MKSTFIALGLAVLVGACSSTPTRATPEPSVAASTIPSPDDGPWPSVAPGPSLTLLPDGVYVHTVVRDELGAAGASDHDLENAGLWTLTVKGAGGTLVLRHDDSNPDETWPIHFSLMGDRVRFQLEVEFFDMRWRLNGASLDLRIVASDSKIGGHSNDALAYRVLNAILGGEWTKTG
jgi:hypothetical protein